MFDKLKQKEALIEKLQSKNVSIKNAIVKKET
jgi:ABC-type transport system substrate-binding protein